VKVYQPDRGWAVLKDVHARNLRWTVTDTDISPDERFLIYSSITPDVHLVRPCSLVLNRNNPARHQYVPYELAAALHRCYAKRQDTCIVSACASSALCS
jgi:hypothetical protein